MYLQAIHNLMMSTTYKSTIFIIDFVFTDSNPKSCSTKNAEVLSKINNDNNNAYLMMLLMQQIVLELVYS